MTICIGTSVPDVKVFSWIIQWRRVVQGLEAVSKGAIVVAWGRSLSPARQYGQRKAARYAVLEAEHINSGKDDVLKTEF